MADEKPTYSISAPDTPTFGVMPPAIETPEQFKAAFPSADVHYGIAPPAATSAAVSPNLISTEGQPEPIPISQEAAAQARAMASERIPHKNQGFMDWVTDAMTAPGTFLGHILYGGKPSKEDLSNQKLSGRPYQMDLPLFDLGQGIESKYGQMLARAFSGFTAPGQLPLAAAIPESGVGRIMSGMFATATAPSVYEHMARGVELSDQGKTSEATQEFLNGGISALMTSLATIHASKGEPALISNLSPDERSYLTQVVASNMSNATPEERVDITKQMASHLGSQFFSFQKEGEELGHGYLAARDDLGPGVMEIAYSELNPEYRGKGLGLEFYRDLQRQALAEGFPRLVSDNIRTDEAERLWQSFIKKGIAQKFENPLGQDRYELFRPELSEIQKNAPISETVPPPINPASPSEGPASSTTPQSGEQTLSYDTGVAGGEGRSSANVEPGANAQGAGGPTPEGASPDAIDARLNNELDPVLEVLRQTIDPGAPPPPDNARGAIGSVEDRPPVISEAVDRDLANGGITVVRGGEDIGLIRRFLGSMSQAARTLPGPAGDIMRAASGRLIDAAIGMARETKDSIDGFRREVRAKVNPTEYGRIVELLNDANVNVNNLPPGLPDNIRDGYTFMRGLMDDHRLKVIQAKRAEAIWGGMTPAKAIQLYPDTWGIAEGYYVHAFPGNWTITYESGVDLRGNIEWQPVDNGWRQTTLSDAQAKAKEYLAANPNANIKVQLDNMTLPGRGIADRARLRVLYDEIKAAHTLIHNGANPDGIITDLRDTGGKLTYGPRRPTPRQFGPTMEREANLPGWATDMDNFERYIIGMERYLQIAPARPELLKLRNTLAQMTNMPPVLKPGELPKTGQYRGDYANSLGRLDASIEALEGYPTGFDAAVRNTLQKMGLDPNLVNNAYGTINSIEAFLKLGFNPASSGLHLAQTIAATYPVLGERWTFHGITHAYASRYDALVKDLGIEATANLLELNTFNAYRGGYLNNISGPIDVLKAGGELAKTGGLYLFSKGVETARRVAAIGAYEKGLSQGMSPELARNYARDTMVRTQFLYNPVDSPLIFKNIPRPMTQFKNFFMKAAEFTTGLRGAEIPRFLAAMGVIGYAGLPALGVLSKTINFFTGYDPENELKRAFPKFSRGALGYLGIDYTKNIGFSDWLSMRGSPASTFLGPGGSDILNIMEALGSYAKGPSREGEQLRDTAMRSISPEARRIWDEASRVLSNQPSLTDPRTGSVILERLTPTERAESLVGLTPLRVSEERDFHEHIRNELEKAKDQKGWFIDRIAELQLGLVGPGTTDIQKAEAMKQTIQLAHEAQSRGILLLPKSILERAKEMQYERLTRDLKKAPKQLRPMIWNEMQKFGIETGTTEPGYLNQPGAQP